MSGAVVLKSIFEEEIAAEYDDVLAAARKRGYSLASYDYDDYEIRGNLLSKYIALVRECKRSVSIPVIASVNCAYSHEWVAFAGELANAGADALELNMFLAPSDLKKTTEETEREYFRIVEKVREEVSLPIALKISRYFTSLGRTIRNLSAAGIAGLVLFKRFFQIDFDVETVAAMDRPLGGPRS